MSALQIFRRLSATTTYTLDGLAVTGIQASYHPAQPRSHSSYQTATPRWYLADHLRHILLNEVMAVNKLACGALGPQVSCELSFSTKEATGLLYLYSRSAGYAGHLSEVSCELSVSTKEATGLLYMYNIMTRTGGYEDGDVSLV
uniref:Uncharacterized protein n=1 Tax=Timema douglasi TaxID=61478 RepID=A0A7R8ZEA1_TIMDO|nr:unnamed protein product [Timema douglasi]